MALDIEFRYDCFPSFFFPSDRFTFSFTIYYDLTHFEALRNIGHITG